MERKETGSYYTNPGLVDELIQSSLKPVVEDRVDNDASTEVQEQQLLDITVCDPAAGSGAFLIAANNFLGQNLAEIRSESMYPDERTVRQARRSVVQHCLYGVDLNPMAVELTKVSLWINSAVEDKPLSFLDHRIKQGNSLVGTTPELIAQGVPADAYETSKGRDWHKGNEIRKRVRNENSELDDNDRQVRLDREWKREENEYVSLAEQLEQLGEGGIDDIQQKEEIYHNLRESESFKQEKLAYDVWTSAFYWPLDGSADEYPTTNTVEQIRRNPPEPSNRPIEELDGFRGLRKRATQIANRESFFHWPLEFPIVYQNGGFDCILGNPPWERIELVEEEFFAVKEPEIAEASTKKKRQRLIDELEESNSELYEDYRSTKSRVEHRTQFLQESGRFPHTGRGNLNTYALFSELAIDEICDSGRSGIIVPTGIATNSRTQYYFEYILDNEYLSSLYDFENRERLFEDVHGQFRFCLLTLAGSEWESDGFELAFYLTQVEDLKDDDKKFKLSKDEIKLINPNTNNLPIFETAEDAKLVMRLYEGVGALLIKDQEGGNPWEIDSSGEFHMGHDADLFETHDELSESGWELEGNLFKKENEEYVPLYESKLIHQYNYRFATFEGASEEDINNGSARQVPQDELDDTSNVILPRYWIPEADYEDSQGGDWHLVQRTITNATNERTVISTIIPRAGAANSINTMEGPSAKESLLLTSFFNSYALNFAARQKLSGSNLNWYVVWQLPVPNPDYLSNVRIGDAPAEKVILDLAQKLVYTANDLSSFAEDIGINREHPYTFSGESRGRDELRFELEATLLHIYNLDDSDIERIFESFNQIKQREIDKYGYYRTREEIKKRFKEMSSKVTRIEGESK
jgi:hypothetical protein